MTTDVTGTKDIYHWYNGGGYYLDVKSLTNERKTSNLIEGLRLKTESLDVQTIAKSLLDVNEKTLRGINNKEPYYFSNEKGNLISYPSGAINYFRNMSNDGMHM